MWAKIDVFIFALAMATVKSMPSKQDDSKPISLSTITPCRPSPCGDNAICTEKNNVGSCTCLPEYFGNPYDGCRPECISNVDCPSHRACIGKTCGDPCRDLCGENAECKVVNHNPTCVCSANYTGDAFVSCTLIKDACLNNADCSAGLACLNQKCIDPCIGTCGENAVCEVSNHTPICSCPEGKFGNPFVKCRTSGQGEPSPLSILKNPCSPSPCGSNSQCREMNGLAVCSYLPAFLGSPPRCRPECIVKTDCSFNFACINQKCVDPCPGACGKNANCRVVNHSPICSCPSGTTGDPFATCSTDDTPCLDNTECSAEQICVNKKCIDLCEIVACGENAACKVSNRRAICKCPRGSIGDPFVECTTAGEEAMPPSLPKNPCTPSPCGPNSQCREMNGQAICSCLPAFLGSPPSCRPECTWSSDCSSYSACINQKCIDPCPGSCGDNATCNVLNHIPVCSCPSGMSGDPFVICDRFETDDTLRVAEESRCSKNADCSAKEACVDERCRDPCSEGLCGRNAECTVVKHIAVCLCPPALLDDRDGPCYYTTVESDKNNSVIELVHVPLNLSEAPQEYQ